MSIKDKMQANSQKINQLLREGKREEAYKLHEENMKLRGERDKEKHGEKLVFK